MFYKVILQGNVYESTLSSMKRYINKRADYKHTVSSYLALYYTYF